MKFSSSHHLRYVCLFAIFCAASMLWGFSPESGSALKEIGGFALEGNDWPWWRGPGRDGIAVADQRPALQWSETENILWKTALRGRGHGSPTVVADQVYLATADYEAEEQSVICLDRSTGKRRWETVVHRGGFPEGGNKKSNLGSSTAASDGHSLYINFLNGGAVFTTALTRDGKQLWQTKISDFKLHQGFGSSPAIFQTLVLASADNHGGGALVALDRSTGTVVWSQQRPKKANYTSPIILEAAGRTQLFLSGCDLVSSFDPLSGRKLWEIEGSTTECVTSVVTDGNLVFTSGGYPRQHVAAVRADGSGEVVWEKSVRVYVPSMLVRDEHIFVVTDAGIAQCWKSKTGEELWKGRLGGTFSSSPVLVGEHIYAVNEEGRTFIFKANPEKFELVAENKLGEEVFATPTICNSRIYMRVAQQLGGHRQEFLYCIAD
jgi:outer membrane protein assembly factor BamB